MTKLMASVSSVADAEAALTGGADMLDISIAGAGGVERISEIADIAAGRAEIGGFCPGGTMDESDRVFRQLAEAGASWIRIAHPVWDAGAWQALDGAPTLTVTLFADRWPGDTVIAEIAAKGARGVLIDLSSDANGRLLDHLPVAQLALAGAAARAVGLSIGFGGALEPPDVPRLLPLRPDFLRFRRALLDHHTGSISPDGVRSIRSLLVNSPRSAESGNAALQGTDRLFVRDFVLPVDIGAYKHEHGRPQKVRFDVTAEVKRTVHTPQDMSHIFSYDVITDGIRAIVARGHVDLAETLAEDIATLILAEPRVTRVSVRVEKLELGPGGVGVEIERWRAG